MKKILCIMAVLMLSACGGDPSQEAYQPEALNVANTQVVQRRDPLYYGYYLTSPTQIAETAGSVNLIWVGGPWGDDTAIANMQAAKLPAVLDVSAQMYVGTGTSHTINPDGEAALRALFMQMDALDLLQYIVAIYPIDEPDLQLSNIDDVLIVNATVRRVASEFPALSGVKLAVWFTSSRGFPHSEAFDWVGFDQHDAQWDTYSQIYAMLVAKLRPGQRTMIMPGAYRGIDPVPFVDFSQSDPLPVAVVPFLWADTRDFLGIRSLPDRKAYCEAGKRVTGKPGSCA